MENERKVGNVEYVLTIARALISDPERWTKGISKIARNVGEKPQYCALGAIDEVALYRTATRGDYFTSRAILDSAIPAPFRSVVGFNDAAETRHPEVLALFDRAIAKAQEKGL